SDRSPRRARPKVCIAVPLRWRARFRSCVVRRPTANRLACSAHELFQILLTTLQYVSVVHVYANPWFRVLPRCFAPPSSYETLTALAAGNPNPNAREDTSVVWLIRVHQVAQTLNQVVQVQQSCRKLSSCQLRWHLTIPPPRHAPHANSHHRQPDAGHKFFEDVMLLTRLVRAYFVQAF